ncbi:MAG: hypothetical protein MZV64_48130 [Ignavibacteriales bacterium]|nr:hypothetical protein [Ignavibacteriales bacterium]
MNIDYSQEAPAVAGRLTLAQIEELIAKPMDTKPDRKYFIAISISLTALMIGAICSWSILSIMVLGLWGNNQPVGWAFDIVNFVFWVGIGHAGTLISAILFLLRQKWRTGIARFAEAMTIFAVMCAGIFPAIHTGQSLVGWLSYCLIQISIVLWVNFTSPLVMGCVCGINLLYCFICFLVCWIDS